MIDKMTEQRTFKTSMTDKATKYVMYVRARIRLEKLTPYERTCAELLIIFYGSSSNIVVSLYA